MHERAAPGATADAAASVRPHRIAVPDEVLTDLRRRLHATRWPDEVPDAEWAYGTSLRAVRELCAHWADAFDWRAAEARLNAWPQIVTEIDGQRVHALHVRSPHAGALPLAVTHGWPGSVVEFEKVLGPLTDPVAFGGDARDAFHVVCPSIPGYGFSGPTTARSWDVGRVADAVAALMARLGYDRYGAQGGDWGAVVASHLAARDAAHVVGIHLNRVVPPPPAGDPLEGLDEADRAAVARIGEVMPHESGYQAIQSTRPQTLAYGLNDSPAGLAAWILEKFRQWSDCDGDPFSVFTPDELCTNLTVYWATGTINSSMRLYYETMGPGRRTPLPRSDVPMAAAIFPGELVQPPRSWAEPHYRIERWTVFERGGHFAALEQPDALVGDIRAFFRTVR